MAVLGISLPVGAMFYSSLWCHPGRIKGNQDFKIKVQDTCIIFFFVIFNAVVLVLCEGIMRTFKL